MWEAAGVETPLPLSKARDDAQPTLPAETAGEQTVLDYAATGLTLHRHPLALLRPRLRDLGTADSRALAAARQGSRLRLPGLVLVRQRPGSAKGVVFFTVEDEHGTANLVLCPDIVMRDRAAVVGARLVMAEGRVERTETAEIPILHLVVRHLHDWSHLLDGLHALEDAPSDRAPWEHTPWDRALANADEVRAPNPRDARDPSLLAARQEALLAARQDAVRAARREPGAMPPSRDFR